MALLKPSKPPLDAERVKALQDEIDAWIDTLAAKEKETAANVPLAVIRALLTARSNGCQCRAYLQAIERGA